MVFSNQGFPDPDEPAEDLSPNHEIVMAADTDTEDEDNNPYNDYEPLPTQELADINDDSDSGNEEDTEDNDKTVPAIIRLEDTLVEEVWAESATETLDNIEMNSDKVDEVKQAMMNFTLPASNIPDWASNIPEEQWKQQLMNRLQQNNRQD